MKKYLFFLALLLISFLLVGCTLPFSTPEIGLVTGSKTDEQAIKEVVEAYFKASKNYEWKTFDKNRGLELWVEESKNELLNNPKKLANLEQSIKENEITRKLVESSITKVDITGDTAQVEATTIENGESKNEAFRGQVQAYEKITLKKINKTWRIQDRSAQILVSRSEK